MNSRIITSSAVKHSATVQILDDIGNVVAEQSFAPDIIRAEFFYGNQGYAEACNWLAMYRANVRGNI